MDVLMICAAILLGILSLFGMAAAAAPPVDEHDISLFNFCGMVFGICLAMFIWVCVAASNHTPTAIVTYHPIVKQENVSFYVNEKNDIVKITGDALLVDAEKAHYRISIYPGGWSCGVYVTDDRKVELVKKAEVEK